MNMGCLKMGAKGLVMKQYPNAQGEMHQRTLYSLGRGVQINVSPW